MPKSAKPKPPKPPKSRKLGRNDPCWCDSNIKYKECHLPREEQRRTEQRQLFDAQEPLLERIAEAVQTIPGALPLALERFWANEYTFDQLSSLDDLEDRGAERFLTWVAFDHLLDDGTTLVERLVRSLDTPPIPSDDASDELHFDDTQQRLLRAWASTRLRVYQVHEVQKGQSFTVTDLLDESIHATIIDHAASNRVQPDDIIIGHLVRMGGPDMISTPLFADQPPPSLSDSYPTSDLEQPIFSIAGSVAHVTSDAKPNLAEFLLLHLTDMQRTQPDASWHDLIHHRSYVLNHFVMALPSEKPDISVLNQFLLKTRVALQLTGASLAGLVGLGGKVSDETTDSDSPTSPTDKPS